MSGTIHHTCGRTLDDFERSTSEVERVSLASLQPSTRVIARTRNSVYRFVVLADRPSVLVEGGSYFPEATTVQFRGSSLGGGPLKIYWIGVGFQMELAGLTERITTSPVCSIEIEDASLRDPFQVSLQAADDRAR